MDNINLEKETDKKETQDSSSILNAASDSSFSSLEKVKTGKNKKVFSFAILTVAVIVLLLLAGYLVDRYTSINLLGGGTSTDVLNKKFSAVFLSNGQVYFGTIEEESEDYTILKNIYYLQVASPLQQVPPNSAQQQPQLVLVKLGTELHGPADYMKINNRHIIFIEELKPDGKVMDAIKRYKVSDQNQPSTQNNTQSNKDQQEPAQQPAN